MKIFKRLFKADYSVCTECGVHFEPISDYEARAGILCAVHREPALKLMRRKEAVMRWAELNWEKLEEQARKDKFDQISTFYDYYNIGVTHDGLYEMNGLHAWQSQNWMSQYMAGGYFENSSRCNRLF